MMVARGRARRGAHGAELSYIVVDPYTDRERLYGQYELFREDFHLWFARALELAGLSADPGGPPWAALDVGCGEALFGDDLARRYPAATIVGFDNDAIAIATALTTFGGRPNLDLRLHDVRHPLDPEWGPPGRFDLVFAHLLFMYLRDPGTALTRLAAALRPGGAIYLRDSPVARFPHPALQSLLDVAWTAVQQIAVPDFPGRQAEYLAQAGFTDITTAASRYVLGGPSPAGRRALSTLIWGLRSARPALVDVLRLLSPAGFDQAMAEIETGLTPALTGEWELSNTIARRPR